MIENAEASFTPHIMSEQEIMHKYWKISMNVRLASIALQRWMSSIVGMISAWSAIRMVFWLSHAPSWDGVVMFIVPLLLLPLLASSYAEVNYEGVKVIQVNIWRFILWQQVNSSRIPWTIGCWILLTCHDSEPYFMVFWTYSRVFKNLIIILLEHPAHREESAAVPVFVWPANTDDCVRACYFLWNYWYCCCWDPCCFRFKNSASGDERIVNHKFSKPNSICQNYGKTLSVTLNLYVMDMYLSGSCIMYIFWV